MIRAVQVRVTVLFVNGHCTHLSNVVVDTLRAFVGSPVVVTCVGLQDSEVGVNNHEALCTRRRASIRRKGESTALHQHGAVDDNVGGTI